MKTKNKIILLAIFAIAFFGYFNSETANAGSCQQFEKCKEVNRDSTSSTGFRSPTGFDCTLRGACAGSLTGTGPVEACCSPTTQLIMDACNGKTAGAACEISGFFTGTCKLVNNSSNYYCSNPANPSNQQAGPTTFVNPLAFSTVDEFLTNFLVVMQRIIVTLSLVAIVYGAILYIVSGGSSTMETGKKAIMAALTGLAIGIAAPSILKELASVLGWGTTNNAAVNGALTFSQIATNVLNFMLGMTGIVALIMMVIGAIMYLTSAGDDKQVETGKKMFKYSLMGVVIAMSAMVLVTQIARFFVAPPTAPPTNNTTH